MLLLLLTLGLVALVMGAMAVGVMVTGRALRGSCGGQGDADCHCKAAGLPVDQRACERFKVSGDGTEPWS